MKQIINKFMVDHDMTEADMKDFIMGGVATIGVLFLSYVSLWILH